MCNKILCKIAANIKLLLLFFNRIGEATLRDFKLLFDRPGQFRYHFKTLDPEFGMVKEEVNLTFL